MMTCQRISHAPILAVGQAGEEDVVEGEEDLAEGEGNDEIDNCTMFASLDPQENITLMTRKMMKNTTVQMIQLARRKINSNTMTLHNNKIKVHSATLLIIFICFIDSHSGDDTPTTNRRRRRGGRGRRRYDRREENVNGSTNETGTVTTEIQSQDWPAISTDIVQ